MNRTVTELDIISVTIGENFGNKTVYSINSSKLTLELLVPGCRKLEKHDVEFEF